MYSNGVHLDISGIRPRISGRMCYLMNVHSLICLLIASTCVPVTCNLFKID